jgi:hypothetical protein
MIALNKPAPALKQVKEIIDANITDLKINLKKLNLKHGDILIAQTQNRTTSNQLKQLYDIIDKANQEIRSERIFVVVLNTGVDIRTMSEKELKLIGLQKIAQATSKKTEDSEDFCESSPPFFFQYFKFILTSLAKAVGFLS